MKNRNDLDEMVLKAPTFMYFDKPWWVIKKPGHVNLAWLTNQWANYQCPNHEEETDE